MSTPMTQRKAVLVDHVPLAGALVIYAMMKSWMQTGLGSKQQFLYRALGANNNDQFRSIFHDDVLKTLIGTDAVIGEIATEFFDSIYKNYNVGKAEKDIVEDPFQLMLGILSEFFPASAKKLASKTQDPAVPVSYNLDLYTDNPASNEERKKFQELVSELFKEHILGDELPSNAFLNCSVHQIQKPLNPFELTVPVEDLS
ncbi:MAG: hypothetical protein HN932_12820 [Candidatus Marinimicrobia bacterium]|jgi:hypothetical protein|nr:hypothetical protein [Candidatus Neomarinimicrobiota bacterium]